MTKSNPKTAPIYSLFHLLNEAQAEASLLMYHENYNALDEKREEIKGLLLGLYAAIEELGNSTLTIPDDVWSVTHDYYSRALGQPKTVIVNISPGEKGGFCDEGRGPDFDSAYKSAHRAKKRREKKEAKEAAVRAAMGTL